MILHNTKELFDFAAMICTNLEKLANGVTTTLSMFGPVTKLKYSIRLNSQCPTLTAISADHLDRRIYLNPEKANQLSPETVTVSIVWAMIRADFPAGIDGDCEADTEALRIITAHYKDFRKDTFTTEFQNLVKSSFAAAERIKKTTDYLKNLQ